MLTLKKIFIPTNLSCKKIINLEHPSFRSHLYIYSPLNTFVIILPFYSNVSVYKKHLLFHCTQFFYWPLKKIKSNFFLNYFLLLRQLQGAYFGYKKIMFLRGMGYKLIVNKSGFLFFKIGLTNKPKLFLNLKNFYFKTKKYQKILVKSFSYEGLIFLLTQIKLFKLPDMYRGKGFLYKGQILKLKKGKRRR